MAKAPFMCLASGEEIASGINHIAVHKQAKRWQKLPESHETYLYIMCTTCLKGKVPNYACIFEKYSEGNVADISIDHIEIQGV